jgi:hypothetical protein
MCERCIRTKVICPGYRDPQSLVFRHQTENIARKFKKPSEARSEIYASRLNSPLQDQGVSIFFQRFVKISSDRERGDLEFLPSMYNYSHPDGLLPVVISSVGLACLSNLRSEPDLLVPAKRQYTEALRLTNEALKDPCESITDQTCMAVVLLGLYEVSILLRI